MPRTVKTRKTAAKMYGPLKIEPIIIRMNSRPVIDLLSTSFKTAGK